MSQFIVLTNEPGRHGFSIVGPFSKAAAEMYVSRPDIEGIVKPLMSPEEFAEQAAVKDQFGDTDKEFES